MGRKSAIGCDFMPTPKGNKASFKTNVNIGTPPKHCRLRVIVDQWNESCVVWNFLHQISCEFSQEQSFILLFAITSWWRFCKTSELKFQIHGHARVEMIQTLTESTWELASTISWGHGLLQALLVACVSVWSPERDFSLSVECGRRDSFASSVLRWVWISLVFPWQSTLNELRHRNRSGQWEWPPILKISEWNRSNCQVDTGFLLWNVFSTDQWTSGQLLDMKHHEALKQRFGMFVGLLFWNVCSQSILSIFFSMPAANWMNSLFGHLAIWTLTRRAAWSQDISSSQRIWILDFAKLFVMDNFKQTAYIEIWWLWWRARVISYYLDPAQI